LAGAFPASKVTVTCRHGYDDLRWKFSHLSAPRHQDFWLADTARTPPRRDHTSSRTVLTVLRMRSMKSTLPQPFSQLRDFYVHVEIARLD
jgi:hypothetical protein